MDDETAYAAYRARTQPEPVDTDDLYAQAVRARRDADHPLATEAEVRDALAEALMLEAIVDRIEQEGS